MAPTEIRRRVFLHLIAAGALAGPLATGCAEGESLSPAPLPFRFFSDEERRALGALADHVLPPDETPGGAGLGAVEYIERLFTALEYDPPLIHAGGPFSGRKAYPDASGAPSKTSPDNGFATFLPLDRVTLAGFRLQIYGSSGVPGGGPNDAVTGPVIGLRDRIQSELGLAMKTAKAPIETLEPVDINAVWGGFSQEFQDAFVELVCEGAFSAPEYGGNRDLLGWKLANFGGDSLPLGYTHFDEKGGVYHERPDAPVSKADTGPDPYPLDDQTLTTLDGLVGLLGGKKFS